MRTTRTADNGGWQGKKRTHPVRLRVVSSNPDDGAELAAELARERARTRLLQQRLATKERELREIHGSSAWAFVSALRTWKLRLLDPLLGVVGVSWPPRAPLADAGGAEIRPAGAAYDVVCLAICGWDERFQRPQQLMSRFAAAGHRVFFVRPELRREGPLWSATEKLPNVYEISLRAGREAEGLDALRGEASIATAATIVQMPMGWSLARQARERFGWPVLYDCMDFHAGFTTVRRSMVADEGALLAEADVVVASSAGLEARARTKRADVLVVRNGCDYVHFAKTQRAHNARPVIGYYGAIADWFDAALVADLAARRTDWDFVLVGSTYSGDIARLARMPNVTLTGEEPYESLPDWLGGFDVAIIPFRRTPLTEATNPVKVYEMLAGGKPVVSVPIPEVAMLAPMVRLASTVDDFEREIVAALAEDASAAGERRAFARQHTWEQRFAVLEGALNRVLSSRGA
ncbi:MAG: hypothetical protein QOH21_1194 [Acidobacteriota bacterium]|nr:hypothetical protein [Acidobacteriota bacterium]